MSGTDTACLVPGSYAKARAQGSSSFTTGIYIHASLYRPMLSFCTVWYRQPCILPYGFQTPYAFATGCLVLTGVCTRCAEYYSGCTRPAALQTPRGPVARDALPLTWRSLSVESDSLSRFTLQLLTNQSGTQRSCVLYAAVYVTQQSRDLHPMIT
eukprot:3938185-Rhodomonas_salina.3